MTKLSLILVTCFVEKDTSRREILNWEQKYNIILGIAKGILYLHADSSIRIIHRDLKENNILQINLISRGLLLG